MKKILVMATAAVLLSGVAFAQDKTKTQSKEKCNKECCKGKDGKCSKTEKKETKTTTTKKV